MLDINTIAIVIQAIVVSLTLLYLARQTGMAKKSLLEIELQTRMNSLVSLHEHTREVNQMLIQEEELLQDLNYTKTDLLIFSIINNLEIRWFKWKEGTLSQDQWNAHTELARKILSNKKIRIFWKQMGPEYQIGFMDFINNIVKKIEKNLN